MLNILADLLEVDAGLLSPDASFADLGMDSLVGLRFARKLQDAFAVEFDAEWLYDHSSVRALAAFLDAAQGQPAAASSAV